MLLASLFYALFGSKILPNLEVVNNSTKALLAEET